jgi:hypothetical protein
MNHCSRQQKCKDAHVEATSLTELILIEAEVVDFSLRVKT